ncbi:MAG: sugar ABC transporter permease, partial [Clostridiales bacterium]|nr:sugar ABC transporter permease [Clostridiales bacterium]
MTSLKKPRYAYRDRPLSRALEPFAYLAPFLAAIAVFTLYPVINVVLMSFKEGYQMLTGRFDQVGVANYAYVLNDRYFMNALQNTAIYVAVVVPLSTVLSILIA